jgi:hypothetical protein
MDTNRFIRIIAGGVMILASLWKFLVLDFWVDRYVPVVFEGWLPYGGVEIVIVTGALGVIAGAMMFLDVWTLPAALFSASLLLIVEFFLFNRAFRMGWLTEPGLVGDIIRNIGLVALFMVVVWTHRRDIPIND